MNKLFLSVTVALFALAILTVMTSVVSADNGLTDYFGVTIDGIEYVSSGDNYEPIAVEAGNTIPVRVVFYAIEDASEVKMSAWIDGYRSASKDEKGVFELVEGSRYSKTFSITVPSDIDPTEEYELVIRIADETKSHQEEYRLKLQRQSYNINVLNVETPKEATAGSTIAVDVVLKNMGMNRLEDVFVKASIPELGVERKVYFEDIDPQDECDVEIDGYLSDEDLIEALRDCDKADSAERRIYLQIPSNAKAGVYNLEVQASNSDFTETVKKSIVISGEGASEVVSGSSSKTISIGQEVTYDLVIVNPGNKVKVYSLLPEDAKGLIVTVDPVVTVSAGDSKTVKVSVKAAESAEEGTHSVVIDVNSENELVDKVTFSANVEKAGTTGKSSIFVLTVILAIVFLVLLIVLIVLLTRKPATIETEETSYY